jgi:8-oxo-dGTP pyrophosphatase MutT (NUDIX family)
MVSARVAEETLRGWQPQDAAQRALREAFLGFLAARPADACRRSCAAGHLTASTLLLDHQRRNVLLTLHPRVGRWIQLGGHCEPADDSLLDAASREAAEESGIDGLTVEPEPLHLDVHPITCSLGRPTRHFDVRFVARAPVGAIERISAESTDLRWWPVDGLPTNTDTVPELVALALQRTLPRTGQRLKPYA